MPTSVTIGAFVFGAVLVLLALVGGGIKLFGAEISGSVGRIARGVAFLLGIALIAYGLAGQPAPPPDDNHGETAAGGTAAGGNGAGRSTGTVPTDSGFRSSTASTAETANEKIHPEPPQVPNIAGIWYDASGTVYQVRQQGSSFTFTGSNVSAGTTSRGFGTIDGMEFETTFETNFSSGDGYGTIAPGARQMTGTYRDTELGVYTLTLYR